MAIKAKKSPVKKPAGTMKDLATRKNPKGGAQKKEGQDSAMKKPGRTNQGSGRMLT